MGLRLPLRKSSSCCLKYASGNPASAEFSGRPWPVGVWQKAQAMTAGLRPLRHDVRHRQCDRSGRQSGALNGSLMRASVNFCLLSGISSSSTSSSFGGFGFGLIDFGSMGNSHSGSSMGPAWCAARRCRGDRDRRHPRRCDQTRGGAETLQIAFEFMCAILPWRAYSRPMPRISRRALPVATVALARYLIGKRLVHASRRRAASPAASSRPRPIRPAIPPATRAPG